MTICKQAEAEKLFVSWVILCWFDSKRSTPAHCKGLRGPGHLQLALWSYIEIWMLSWLVGAISRLRLIQKWRHLVAGALSVLLLSEFVLEIAIKHLFRQCWAHFDRSPLMALNQHFSKTGLFLESDCSWRDDILWLDLTQSRWVRRRIKCRRGLRTSKK